jgi:hypothetical protein
MGVLAFLVLFIGIPLAWFIGQVPLALTRPAEAAYGLVCAAISAAILSAGGGSGRLRSTFWMAFAGFATLVVLMFGTLSGIDAFFSLIDFTAVTETRYPAPSGRLVAVVRDVDQGALGADSEVSVRAPLIPGVVSWNYSVTLEDYVDEVNWDGPGVLIVQGKRYSVPPALWVLSR